MPEPMFHVLFDWQSISSRYADCMPELRSPQSMYLVPLAGPALEAIQLVSREGGLVIGRHEQCDLCLPADAEKVSRFHARFGYDGARWHIADLGSRWGTFVNGMKLAAHADTILSGGDLIRITPWTFTLSATPRGRGLQPRDDAGQTFVRTLAHDTGARLADATLSLLLESAAAIHAATDEKQLSELLIDAAIRGTSLQNAVMLRPLDADGHMQIIASRFAPPAQEQNVSFSRSLIAAASQGSVAELDARQMPDDVSQSIVQLRINSAICVPLTLGGTVAAYLYLDSRGTLMHSMRPGASAFCAALGNMASLALANLKRVEMERREAAMQAELAAAAVAQKWILPKREGAFGALRTIGESRAGQYVGGDFFDIIPLDENRLAVALGDVSGKGISASVLMTATQGFLHAALKETRDPAAAVNQVNAFVNPRRPESKFVTAWVGVFDVPQRTLRYVDAGHSYALLRRANGTIEPLNRGGGIPIGVEEEFSYHAECIAIGEGDRVMIVSDGIIEQFGVVANAEGSAREQFEMHRVEQAMNHPSTDEVADLFAAVIAHAGADHLADDATAVLVRWESDAMRSM